MPAQPISLLDWKRLLMGTAPAPFLLEMLFRCVVVYSLFIIIVRLLGKRMMGQVANLELGVMISLGAIVSVPLQMQERGIVPAIVLLVSLLGLHQLLSLGATRYFRVEGWVQGHSRVLVRDGTLVLEQLRKNGISQEQLFSVLRSQSIQHLGEVKRVYLEACGSFSVIRDQKPRAGLSVMPSWDAQLQVRIPRSTELRACRYCGHVSRDAPGEPDPCPRCHHLEFAPPVAVPEADADRRQSEPVPSGQAAQ